MKEKKTFSNQKKKKILKESVGSWRRAPGIRIRASSPRDSEACRCHGNGTGRAFKAQEPRVFIGPQTGNDRDGAGSGTRGGNSAVVRVGIDRGRKVGPIKTDEEGTFHEPATWSSLCLFKYQRAHATVPFPSDFGDSEREPSTPYVKRLGDRFALL